MGTCDPSLVLDLAAVLFVMVVVLAGAARPFCLCHHFPASSWAQGSRVLTALQVIFAGLYLATQAVVMALYIQAKSLPPWSLALLCLSRRLHSIFLLRLFNDCWAMLVAYGATLALQASRGCACVPAWVGGVEGRGAGGGGISRHVPELEGWCARNVFPPLEAAICPGLYCPGLYSQPAPRIIKVVWMVPVLLGCPTTPPCSSPLSGGSLLASCTCHCSLVPHLHCVAGCRAGSGRWRYCCTAWRCR